MAPRKKKAADMGSKIEAQILYWNESTQGWSKSIPKQLDLVNSRTYDDAAIKVYKRLDKTEAAVDGTWPMVIREIEIQNPLLITHLKPILKTENVHLHESKAAKFSAPFHSLFFCYDQILKLEGIGRDDIVFGELYQLLMDILDEIFGEDMQRLEELKADGLVSCDLAWMYFPRNTVVYSAVSAESLDTPRAYRVVQVKSDTSMTCRSIAFDGKSFSWESHHLSIPVFAGNLPITSLSIFPLEYHDNDFEIKKQLTTRAEAVLDYQELQYREYDGLAWTANRYKKCYVSGRILIDCVGYHSQHQDYPLSLTAHSADQQESNKTAMLAQKDDLIFVSPILKGFALKKKQWLEFHIDHIKPIVWNEEAWNHLVYDKAQKDLVATFVQSHHQVKAGIDDVIAGKGLGLVFLLSGPPGTGKTLTAEAVADKAQRPLYYLQAEELGISPDTLGTNIKRIFKMATHWNAVILLDEADVFMAKRSPTDIVRNELVSIFLRELEYFQGIIFLTTNLFDTIDAAFRSRANIHLVFSPLSFDARRQLWEKSLERLPKGDQKAVFSSGDLMELAKWELNGREIKNAIKTVRNWCVVKKIEINLEKFESGIRSTAPQAIKQEDHDMGECVRETKRKRADDGLPLRISHS